jgi:hypothetical protein
MNVIMVMLRDATFATRIFHNIGQIINQNNLINNLGKCLLQLHEQELIDNMGNFIDPFPLNI